MDITEQTLLDELANSEPAPLDEKTEVCVAMYCERTGTNQSTALRRLKDLEKTGYLTSRPAIWRGHHVTAYRKAAP